MKTLLGQTLAEGRPIYMALTSVFGIGRNKAFALCNTVGISPQLRVFQVPNNKIRTIAQVLLGTSPTVGSRISTSVSTTRGPASAFVSSPATTNANASIQGLTGIELKKQIHDNIKKLVDMKAYRGFRHVLHLPSRGQRTKTNARTARKSKTITVN